MTLRFSRRSASVIAAALLGLGITGGAHAQTPKPDRGQRQAAIIFQILASELALAQGQVGVAAATYLALAKQTQDPAAAKRAVELAIEARSTERAEEAAAIWLKSAPEDREAQGTLDLLQVLRGEADKLAQSLAARRATLADPKAIDDFYDYVAGLTGRFPKKEDALKVFEQVTEPDRDRPSVTYTRAMLHERAGNFAEMERLLRALIAQDPKHAHAHNALGYHLADRNERLPEAYRLIQQALALAPNDAHIIDSMGWVYFRMGKLAEAERYLRNAYKQQSDAEIAAHLGEVLWAKGQTSEAETFWRAGFLADPRNEVLLETIRRLGVPPMRIHPQ
jgi:tetratricopeptide (TPR) repeat protein